MTREFLDSLDDMIDAIRKAQSFCEGMTFKAFAKDERTVYAAIHAIEIIGEAAKKVPPGIRKKQPNIPWRDITGMRDKLAHEYFGVDLQTVWTTIHEDLPSLLSLVQALRDHYSNGAG